MSGRTGERDHRSWVEMHIRENLFPDEVHIRELLELFFLTVAERLALAETARSDGDWRELERLAHAIRGACAHVGAECLTSVAAGLEAAAARHDDGAARRGLREANDLFEGLRDEAAAVERQ